MPQGHYDPSRAERRSWLAVRRVTHLGYVCPCGERAEVLVGDVDARCLPHGAAAHAERLVAMAPHLERP